MARRTKTAKYRYNIITTQKGRMPLWSPDEALAMLDAVEQGNLAMLDRYQDRICRYISDRREQLRSWGLTEERAIPLFAEIISMCNSDHPDYRQYLHHVKEHMEAGTAYIMPNDWKAMKEVQQSA